MGFEVTAISSSPGKREEALTLGANRFIAVSDKAALNQAEFYFDLLYITAHGGIAWGDMMKILKKKGKLVLSGFPQVNLSSVDLVSHELSIVGSFLGTQAEMREMLNFAFVHKIKPILELMPMSQVNQAIEKLKQNKVRYRIVLVNDIL